MRRRNRIYQSWAKCVMRERQSVARITQGLGQHLPEAMLPTWLSPLLLWNAMLGHHPALHSHPSVEESIEEGRPRSPYVSLVPGRLRGCLPPGASSNLFYQIPI